MNQKSFHSFLLVLSIFLTGNQVIAQNRLPMSGKEARQIEIKGQILDGETELPVEFATISLFNTSDSTLVGGALSDDKGNFKLAALPGAYYAQIQFLTYMNKDVAIDLVVSALMKTDLGQIILEPATKELDEVVVQTQRTQMELQLDKKVYNVGKDLSNLGGSASDILSNLPSVAVDVDGTISLRGSSSVRVLIDGKPSGLVGLSSSDALRQLQGNLVERVEIITNPSARYDAEGQAGIINIILKKEKAKGINGSFTLNTGYPNNHGGSVSVNLRRKWVNLFANVGGGYRMSPGMGSSRQYFTYPDTTYTTISNRDMERASINYSARMGADFYLGKNATLTTYYLTRLSNENNFTTLSYKDYGQDNSLRETLRTDDGSEDEANTEFGLNFEENFKRKGHKLTIDFQYQENNEDQNSLVFQDFKDLNALSFVPVDFMSSENTESEKRTMFQTDYVHPFAEKGQFELGSRITSRDISNDYLIKDSEDGTVYSKNVNLSNNFQYIEGISAFYGIFSSEYEKLTYQLGTRYEISDVTTELLDTQERSRQQYSNFFPSAFFTYSLANEHKLQASYSRRIGRPRFRNLNPFVSISDARNYRVGNPNLLPSYTDSYELGYLQNFEKSSLYYGAYYRHSTGIDQNVTTLVDTLGLERVKISRPENLGFRNSLGIEMNGSLEISKWWSLNGNANFYHSNTEGVVYDGNEISQVLKAEAYSFSTRLSNNLKFGDLFDAQVNLMYRAPENSTQGRRLSMTSLDLGFSKDVIKKNATVSLSVRDLFNSRKYRGTTDLEYYHDESEFQWASRQVNVSFTYRLNQKKKRGGNRENQNYGEEMEGF